MREPTSCQHRRIDNSSYKCLACGEAMVGVTIEAVTVVSAPNLAACTNPACSGDVDDPNCTGGGYVADMSRAEEVVVGWQYDYECARCQTGGNTVITATKTIEGCGLFHQGDLVRPTKEVE